jgi:hypothetical protein
MTSWFLNREGNSLLPYKLRELQRDGEIWERHGIKGIQYDQCIVADSWVKEMDARRGQTLLFEYFANRNFEIIVTNGNQWVDWECGYTVRSIQKPANICSPGLKCARRC